MEKQIWSCGGTALGDCWASINYILKKGKENNRTEYVSKYYLKGKKKKYYYNKANEILNILDTDEKIVFVDEDPTHKLKWRDIYKVKYYPTKSTWRENNSKNICFQFDGKSHKCKNMKNIYEENEIHKSISENGFNSIRLGGDKTLKDCMEIMSKCEFFIGVDSGFSHMASSVGIPIFMVVNGRRYQGIKDSHEGRSMLLCENYISLINSIERYTKDIYFYKNNRMIIS